jgi:DNA-binding CsgD family transcriptional regulator
MRARLGVVARAMPKDVTVQADEDLRRHGRDAYARRAWTEAYTALAEAGRTGLLSAVDLEALATAAYMLGRDDDYVAALERAHHAHLEAGEVARAVRCAFWMGITLAQKGDVGPATGWLGRAQRLLERTGEDCVERGYLLMPVMFRHEAAGDFRAAAIVAAEAATIAERFGDPDAIALAVHAQGHMLIRDGQVEDGLALLDEAMVIATSTELSPIATGLVYCGVILACQEVHELRRAREWTAVLARWCGEQPDLVAFTGRCLIHRAEIMQLHGAWPDALEEARRASERLGLSQAGTGQAFYLQGEIHRLCGEFDAAERAYREASRCGREPQPGMVLLRLAQGRTDVAAATIRRVASETSEPLRRAALLPACVEIMLAAGDTEQARRFSHELAEIATSYGSGMLDATATHARGAVELTEGDNQAALGSLRHAWQVWQELEAPYEAARARVLIALACRALGDEDTAALELQSARDCFEQLAAAPDVARIDTLVQRAPSHGAHGLSARELEVLRLVAAGKTNRDIARALVISEHTVARHIQNIFAKLHLSSRTAASAFAFEHELV